MPQDSDLPVDAARRGDPDAWEILCQRYQLPLYSYVTELVRHPPTALDIVQDAFVRAARNLASLRDSSRFGSWLFGIAHQRVILHWRRQGCSPFSDDPLPLDSPDPSQSPDQTAMECEDGASLLAAVDALPVPQRCVILLHFLEDFPLAEIATITGVSLGTVKSRLHYAKRTLRQRLAPQLERDAS